jgi:hypothetical protein
MDGVMSNVKTYLYEEERKCTRVDPAMNRELGSSIGAGGGALLSSRLAATGGDGARVVLLLVLVVFTALVVL